MIFVYLTTQRLLKSQKMFYLFMRLEKKKKNKNIDFLFNFIEINFN